jgi:hypothetical protein
MIPKFRAWHKGAKKMYTVLAIDFTRNQIEIDTEVPSKHLANECVIMQVTPFEDMFGTPIYEDDIITDSRGSLYQVQRDESSGTWLANQTLLNTLLNNHALVILGNIHRNAELLLAFAGFEK